MNQFRQPKYLFSGLTKCGECGAGFIVYSRDQLGCFGTRDRGTCTNELTISRQEVEARVLRGSQDKLMRKDFFEEFCHEFAKEMNRLRMEHRAGLSGAKRELERVKREIRKVDRRDRRGRDGSRAKGPDGGPAEQEGRPAAAARRGREPQPLLHPSMADLYRSEGQRNSRRPCSVKTPPGGL